MASRRPAAVREQPVERRAVQLAIRLGVPSCKGPAATDKAVAGTVIVLWRIAGIMYSRATNPKWPIEAALSPTEEKS